MKHRHQNGHQCWNSPRRWLPALLLFSAFTDANPAKAEETVAFLGDSLTTGAVTDPNLVFDAKALWDIFRGSRANRGDGAPAPVRLAPGPREYTGAMDWVSRNLLNVFSQVYLDTEELSWAFTLGTRLGFPPGNILVAAEDGARMKAGLRQVDRVLDKTGGVIPNKLFVFFSGNDLCGPSMDFVTTAEEYGEQLEEMLEYLLNNGRPAAGGSHVYVVGHMGVMQIVTSPAILAKEIPGHGKTLTCKSIADYTGEYQVDEKMADAAEAMYFFRFFPKTPASMCPTVFGKNVDYEGDGQAAVLANRIREYRRVSREVAERKAGEFRKHDRALSLSYVGSTESLVFEPQHIASDCFHLSAVGQQFLAEQVFADISAPKEAQWKK